MERRLKQAGYEVATYPSAQHLLDHLPSESVPSCILLDVRIPGLSGPELQKRLSELGSTLPIIFLTGYPDIPTTVQAIKAGADDFLTKPVSSDDLLQAIERAIAHHEVTRGLKSKLDMVRAHVAALTPREREVFELVIRGDTNKQVARALGCTERTIKAHRHRVMEKMQVRSLAELVSLAERVGVLCRLPDRQSRRSSTSLALLLFDGTIENLLSGIRIETGLDLVCGPQGVLGRTGQGCRTLPNRNLVLVVDDDPGMLKGVQRLLRQHDVRTHPVFVRGGFQKPHRFREGGLRHSRHQPERRVRDRAEASSQG